MEVKSWKKESRIKRYRKRHKLQQSVEWLCRKRRRDEAITEGTPGISVKTS